MIGKTLNGRFRLERELGRGGMGAVYRAIDSVLERPVAIKVLTKLTGDEVSRRIRLEAQILARLLHENVVRLYDFSSDGETFYYIMEEVDGPSFARRARKIGLIERIEVLIQTARALDYAHHQGVIHRDVKPANILLTSTDQAKLSDFGLSLIAGQTQDSGVVRGTPHYMSPEQARGQKIDHRTDLYALGVMLYESATGTPPFSGPVMSIMSQHIHAEPEPPRTRNPAITEEFEALILGLMAKDPFDRPSSGSEVSARLIAMINSGVIASDLSLHSPGNQAVDRTRSGQSSSIARSQSQEIPDSPRIPSGAGSYAPSLASSQVLVTTGTSVAGSLSSDPIAERIVAAVNAEPIALNPEERYLFGHYLGYLLGGSRRRGFLLRRPLDQINADRASLLLVMTALTLPDGESVDIAAAASLIENRTEIRTLLSPVVVAKYLQARSTLPKRKRFRQIRQQLLQSSEYAARHLTDDRGVLNPGLMPQTLEDLRRLAPARTELDDQLVDRWNEVAEIWRSKPGFRMAVLRYATRSAWNDPASSRLWPEVVYPLIERARMQRQYRSNAEALWDTLCGAVLHVGDAGVKMDRAIRSDIPQRIVREIELSLHNLVAEDAIEAAADIEVAPPDEEARIAEADVSIHSFRDLEVDAPTRSFVRLVRADPFRQTVSELREMGKEAVAAMRAGGASIPGQRVVTFGLYRLVVIPSVRSRSAGQLAIQGMPNKQIELLVPPFLSSGPAGKFLIAVWLYRNNSLAISYYDNLNDQKFIIWDASVAQQTNLEDLASFNHHLYTMGLEVPDQVERVLTKSYRPVEPNM